MSEKVKGISEKVKWISEKVKKISEKMKGLSEKVLLCQRHASNRVESAQSVIISREGLILTLSILPCPQGRIF